MTLVRPVSRRRRKTQRCGRWRGHGHLRPDCAVAPHYNRRNRNERKSERASEAVPHSSLSRGIGRRPRTSWSRRKGGFVPRFPAGRPTPPSPAQDNLLALATDGALIIAAVGSLQTRLETVLDVTDRLCAMTLQFSIDKRTAVGRTIANDQENASSFVTDFAELFREYWTAPRGAFTEGLCHTVVSVYKGDTEGNVLFGVLDRWSAKREQIYSSACLPVHGHSNPSASLPLSRGGSLFMPAAIANLAETLYARLDRTAGAIDVCA